MTTPLEDHVTRIRVKGKIGFGDARRLFRDALPAGIETREEAELLGALDRAVPCVDPTWPEWFIPAFLYFILSREAPRAGLNEEELQWLRQVLAGDGEPTKRGADILREVQRATACVEADPLTDASVRMRARHCPEQAHRFTDNRSG